MQGDGEIAGHTADVAGTVTLQVEVVKGLGIDGPVLFPLAEDLPFLAKPLTADGARARAGAGRARGRRRDRGVAADLGRSAPARTSTPPPTTACARAAELLGMTRAGGHEPGDDRGRDRDRPRARASSRSRSARRPRRSRRPACCPTRRSSMPERDGTPRAPRAGSTSRRPTSTTPTRFYGELFGWEAEDAGTIEETGGYRFFLCGGKRVAGVGPLMQEGQPVVWSTYFATDDVDALAARVTEFGGDVVLRADGRHGRRPDGRSSPTRRRRVRRLAGRATTRAPSSSTSPVSLAWNTLITPRPEDAAAFFGARSSASAPRRRSSAARDYVILTLGEQRRRRADGPAARDARGRAGVLGRLVRGRGRRRDGRARGRARRRDALEPMDMPGIGRIATVTDPWGASFSVAALDG